MEKISKKEMIDAVAELSGQTKKATADIIDSMIQFIMATTKSGNAVVISRDFGTFKPVQRKERTVNTPMMSGAKTVPAKTALAFKASKAVQL